ncbi:GNAT family N-acetyltransferase [Streptomyces lavendulae]|uniref:GNAT family N-acetyltransferase n=1 Tax=Streptomyces lavendulae TaxID=1914 RepID=UPI003F4CE3BB
MLEPAELDLAFVSDEAQGTGVGRLLMEHMLGQARRAGLTDVRVVSNPPAERFYLRMGAERVGGRRHAAEGHLGTPGAAIRRGPPTRHRHRGRFKRLMPRSTACPGPVVRTRPTGRGTW